MKALTGRKERREGLGESKILEFSSSYESLDLKKGMERGARGEQNARVQLLL